MHHYDPVTHSFIIQTLDDNATVVETQRAPSILVNEQFIYRWLSQVTAEPFSTSGPDKLVGAATTPARSLVNLPADAVFNDPEVEPRILINAATLRNTIDCSDIKNYRIDDWKLFRIVLHANDLVLWFVRVIDAAGPEPCKYVRVQLSGASILQMGCHISTELAGGVAYSEHYNCSTDQKSIGNHSELSFRVEYHATSIAKNDTEALPPDFQKPWQLKGRYTHSEINYSDSYIA